MINPASIITNMLQLKKYFYFLKRFKDGGIFSIERLAIAPNAGHQVIGRNPNPSKQFL